MNNKVIELIRVSTEGQAAEDRAGIPAQRAANRRTATQHRLDIVRTIEFADVSGASVLHAPEMRELLRLIESPEICGVVAKEFSRLMRPENFADYTLLQSFADTGTILYLPEGPIDFRSKTGRLFGALRAAIAGLERTEILERVWSAKEEKRRAGKNPQSEITLPFGVGYDMKGARWFYKPDAEKVREAFRLFLSGETSYTNLGRQVGIEPFNLRIILRNPIYTGWRVIDKKRDMSPGAKRIKAGGRQGDRPKIARAPDEVIRVRVLEPLVREEDFQRTQQIMDLKKLNHWRMRPEQDRRFTYSGFLKCGLCGNLVYTHVRKPHDWYVCKSRTTAERQLRESKGLASCTNPYMQREQLERRIDQLFSSRLTDREFLEQIASKSLTRSASGTERAEVVRLQKAREQLDEKRRRVLETYFDNLIDRATRDKLLSEIETDVRFYENILLKAPPATQGVSANELAEVFGPLHEWVFLSRFDKRRILQAVGPEIHVENYKVKGISLLARSTCRNEVTHMGTDSSPPPA
jgi:DNA invertase Pin-like site-specific DNA recombinase